MKNPQEAYNILLSEGNVGFLRSAIDIGDRYLFIFEPIAIKKSSPPITGPFRLSVNKEDGKVSLFNMLNEKIKNRIDVTKNIKTIYDKKIGGN